MGFRTGSGCGFGIPCAGVLVIGWIGSAERRLCARIHVVQPCDALESRSMSEEFAANANVAAPDGSGGVNYCRRRSFQLKFNTSIVEQPFCSERA